MKLELAGMAQSGSKELELAAFHLAVALFTKMPERVRASSLKGR